MKSDANLNAPIRILIADDEPLARDLLKRLTSESAGFELVGECRDGRDVVNAAASLEPDVILMDIQMPNMTGIEAALEIRRLEPVVVFVTAYEQHAIEAFAARGFHYLVKPIIKRRFAEAMTDVSREVRRRRLEKSYNSTDRADDVGTEIGQSEQLEFIRVRAGTHIHIIDIQTVRWFEAANQYVRIHSNRGEFLISSTSLNSLEAQLDPNAFIRVHRSALINKKFVKGVRSDGGAYVAELTTGEQIGISRRNKIAISEAILRTKEK